MSNHRCRNPATMARMRITARESRRQRMEQTCPQGVPSGSLVDPCTRAPEGLQECANQKLTETRNSRKRKQQKKKNRSQTSGFCLLARSTVRKEGFTVPCRK